MKKLCLVLFFAAVTLQSAHATFLTYPQWEALSVDSRNAYISGAFDSLEVFGMSGTETGRPGMHYYHCLKRIKMNNAQLAEGVRAVALNDPELQGLPVQAALIQYLNKLCGEPPK
jgi:hypothetical protein